MPKATQSQTHSVSFLESTQEIFQRLPSLNGVVGGGMNTELVFTF